MKDVPDNTADNSAPGSGAETNAESAQSPAKKIINSGILRLAGWWSIFAGALALNSVCPICGSTACPVGIGATGVLAGLLAAIKLYGARVIKSVVRIFRASKPEVPVNESKVCSCGSCHGHMHHNPGEDHHTCRIQQYEGIET